MLPQPTVELRGDTAVAAAEDKAFVIGLDEALEESRRGS